MAKVAPMAQRQMQMLSLEQIRSSNLNIGKFVFAHFKKIINHFATGLFHAFFKKFLKNLSWDSHGAVVNQILRSGKLGSSNPTVGILFCSFLKEIIIARFKNPLRHGRYSFRKFFKKC